MCGIKAGTPPPLPPKQLLDIFLTNCQTLDPFPVLNDDLSICVKRVDLSSSLIFRRLLCYPSQKHPWLYFS